MGCIAYKKAECENVDCSLCCEREHWEAQPPTPSAGFTGYVCAGCNVQGSWEHRCHGAECTCDNLTCKEQQGRITHSEMMEIIHKENNT